MYIMYIVKSLKESQLIHQLQLYSIDEDCISFHYYGRILKEKIICKLFLYEACLKKKRKQKNVNNLCYLCCICANNILMSLARYIDL